MSNRITDEQLSATITINASPARKELIELDANIRKTTADIKQMKEEQERLERQNKVETAEYRKLTNELKNARAQKKQYQAQSKALRAEMRLSEMTMAELAKKRRELNVLMRNTVPGTDAWRQYRTELTMVNNRLSELNMKAKATGESMGVTLGKIAGIAAAGYALKSAFDPFVTFEKRMDQVRAVFGATDEEFKRLTDDAKRLGESTEYTATQVADMQLNYARLGFVPDQILAITEATLNLATATGEDLAASADVAGFVLRAFGYGAEEMPRVIDVMTNSFNKSSLSLDNYSESIKYVAPVAAAANVSLEETTAMLGVLADRGIRGSMAGTALRTIFSQLKTEGKSLSEAISDLNEKGLTLSESEEEVGRYAMTALKVLADGKPIVDDLTMALEDSAGAAAETAAVMRDNLQGDLDSLSSKAEGVVIWFGEKLNPVLRGFVQLLTASLEPMKYLIGFLGSLLATIKLISVAQAFLNKEKKTTIKLNGLEITSTRALVAALKDQTTFTKLLSAAKLLLTGNIKAATIAFRAFVVSMGPIGWIITGVSALGAAYALWGDKLGKVNDEKRIANEIDRQAADNIATEKEQLRELLEVAEDKTLSDEKRVEAMKELQRIIPGGIALINEETIANGKAAEAVDKYTDSVKRLNEEKMKEAQGKLEASYINELDEIESGKNKELSHEQKSIITLRSGGDKDKSEKLTTQFEDENVAASKARYAKEREALKKYINTLLNDTKEAYSLSKDTYLVEEKSKLYERYRNKEIASEKEYKKQILKLELERMNDVLKQEQLTAEERAAIGDQIMKKELELQKLNENNKTIDSENKKYSLSNDETYLSEKLKLREQLLSGEIKTEEDYNARLLALEINTLEARIALGKEKGQDLLNLQMQLAEKRYQQSKKENDRLTALNTALSSAAMGGDSPEKQARREKAAYDKRLKDLGLFGRERSALTEMELEALEQLEREHQKRMADIQDKALMDAISKQEAAADKELKLLQLKHATALAAFTGTQKQREALEKQFAKEEANLQISQLQQELGHLQTLLNNGEFAGIDLENNLLSEEQKNAVVSRLVEVGNKISSLKKESAADAEKDKEPVFSFGSTEKEEAVDIMGMSSDDWNLFFDHLKAGKLGFEDMVVSAQGISGAFSMYNDIATAAENAQLKKFEKNIDKKKAKEKERLNAGLISQETYNARIAEMDEELDAKKEEIEKKQAKRNKVQAIFDSIIATAVAVTKALPNIPLSVLVGILGAAQTAMIAAQPLPGAEEGGPIDVVRQQDGRPFRADNDPDRRGFVSRPTVIRTSGGRRVLVGENGGEYVIPAEGLENPSLRPLIDTIEAARTTGRLRRLNLSAVIPGRAAGGYTESYTGSPASAYPWTYDDTHVRRNEEIITANTAVMQQLSDRLKRGINAYSVLTGTEGLEKQQQRLKRIRNNTQI